MHPCLNSRTGFLAKKCAPLDTFSEKAKFQKGSLHGETAVTSDRNQKFLRAAQKSGVFGQKASPVGVFGKIGQKMTKKKGQKWPKNGLF